MDINKVGDRGGNINFTKAGLAQSGNCVAGNFKSTAPLNFIVDGVFNQLGIQDNIVFSSGHTALTGCNECYFAVWVNANNAIATTQGKIVDPAKLGGSGGQGVNAVPLPDVVSGNALIGLIKVKAGTGVTFTPGTTNLNATNITTTFLDCSTMPTVPALT